MAARYLLLRRRLCSHLIQDQLQKTSDLLQRHGFLAFNGFKIGHSTLLFAVVEDGRIGDSRAREADGLGHPPFPQGC